MSGRLVTAAMRSSLASRPVWSTPAYPGISLLVLAVVLSVWLLFYGVMEITLAFRLRSLGHRAGTRPVHAV